MSDKSHVRLLSGIVFCGFIGAITGTIAGNYLAGLILPVVYIGFPLSVVRGLGAWCICFPFMVLGAVGGVFLKMKYELWRCGSPK